MATRISTRALGSRSSRLSSFVIRRPFSSTSSSDQTRFSYALPIEAKVRYRELFDTLREKKTLANPSSHNAAVLLATPDFAKSFEDEEFMGSFAKLMSASADVNQFHVLSAIVDHVAPPVGSYKPLRGISVLRGHLDDILPGLWQPAPPKSRDDADAVSALTFNLGRPSITLPLARTTFHNNKGSTLFASQFDLSRGAPRITRSAEKHSQNITLSLDGNPQSIADLGLWAPLVPLTFPRVVTESFGNIIRGIEVDEKTIPASTELENVVNKLHKQNASTGIMSGPVGVWAMVTPAESDASEASEWLANGPEPIHELQSVEDVQVVAQATSKHLNQLYSHGSRLYKILSGGGGWGAKKGLLSLDPQRTHFALSEEEEMARFMQTMNDSSFTPRGSRIQFFMSTPALPSITEPLVPGVAFGVPGETAAPEDPESVEGFIGQHFGALSNQAVYIAGPGGEETKLSVPHSRIYVTENDTPGSLFGALATGLAKVGTATLIW